MREKIKNFIFNLNIISRFLGYGVFRSIFFKKFKLKITKFVPKGKVLVLAPHPDDEVFGCGGALKLHSLQNDPIKIIYFTASKKISAKRVQEAQKAMKTLSISDLLFWKNPDGDLLVNFETIKDLIKVIMDYKPRVIYVSTFLDPHSDHLTCAKILNKALSKINYNPWIFSYEIWSPIYVNRLVVIDKVINFKKRAIRTYKSQLIDRPYLQAILGLNQYRAKIFNAGDYAEGFFVCDARIYLKMVKQLLK
jgi:LmbE family N-acetylglucosaminyl deacetylase